MSLPDTSSLVDSSSESRGLGHSLLDSLADQSAFSMVSSHFLVDFLEVGMMELARRSQTADLISDDAGKTLGSWRVKMYTDTMIGILVLLCPRELSVR